AAPSPSNTAGPMATATHSSERTVQNPATDLAKLATTTTATRQLATESATNDDTGSTDSLSSSSTARSTAARLAQECACCLYPAATTFAAAITSCQSSQNCGTGATRFQAATESGSTATTDA